MQSQTTDLMLFLHHRNKLDSFTVDGCIELLVRVTGRSIQQHVRELGPSAGASHVLRRQGTESTLADVVHLAVLARPVDWLALVLVDPTEKFPRKVTLTVSVTGFHIRETESDKTVMF